MIQVANSFFQINEKQIDLEKLDPSFRKATLNMIAAYDVCKSTLESASLLNHTAEQKKSVSFVLATYFGEVSSSLDFLTTLHDSKIAKPILFQNSLHNSTLGFVSIQLGLKGPALTISADNKTEQAVHYTAASLLELTDYVLVCHVDIVPDFLKKYYTQTFKELDGSLGYAKSYLLTKNET